MMHAGLECGIIGANYPGLDMISFGPTIKHPHSPNEKLRFLRSRLSGSCWWQSLKIFRKRLNTIFVKSRRYGKRYRRLFVCCICRI